MKNIHSLTVLLTSAMVLAACGGHQKNPVNDFDKLREQGRTQMNEQDKTPQPVPVAQPTPYPVPTPYPQPTPVVQEKLVYVEKTTIDGTALVFTAPQQISFNEGEAGSFQITTRVTVPGAKVTLVAKGLPDGAKLTNPKPGGDTYTVSWTPGLNIVPSSENSQPFQMSFFIELTEVKDEKLKNILTALDRSRTLVVFVQKNKLAPKAVEIQNLPASVDEGSLTPFQVIATVPGITKESSDKPDLMQTRQGQAGIAGTDLVEKDGTAFAIPDSSKQVQYLGDFKWKYHFLFDARQVGFQLDKKNQPRETDSIVTKIGFRVLNMRNRMMSPDVVQTVKIETNKPVGTPRIEIAGLTNGQLTLTAGQKLKLSIVAESASARAQVKLETSNLATLPGSPTLTCVASKKGAARQECTLQWSVPCTTEDKDLTQEIQLTAIASIGGKNSEPVTQTLKTIASGKGKVNCAAPAAPKEKKK